MKKIFPTILVMFLIVVISTFPTITKKNTLRTNFEIEKQTFPTHTIYLLNQNNYLTEVEVMLSEDNMVPNIIDYLKEDYSLNNKWKGYIPTDVKIIDYQLKNGLLEIHFSEEIKKIEQKYLPGIVESLLKQKGIEKVELYINKDKIESIPSINLIKETINRKDIDKIVVFYIEDTNDNNLIPVTKYLEKKDDKMNAILEELKNNIPINLISYVTDQLKINNYTIENDIMIVDFNHTLIDDPDKRKWLLEEISYSIMKNYQVNAVLFKVDGKQEELILK